MATPSPIQQDVFENLCLLATIVRRFEQDSLEKKSWATNTHAVNAMLDKGKLEALCSFLADQGFRRLDSSPTLGKRAIVFKSVNNQMLRISAREPKGGRMALDEILQPLISHDIGDFRVEVLPEVKTTGVTTQHVRELTASLARKEYLFWDMKRENVGLLHDGTPVILDGDAVIPFAHMHDIMTDGLSLSRVKPDDLPTYLQSFIFMLRFKDPSIMDISMFDEPSKSFEGELEPFKTMAIPARDFKTSQSNHVRSLGLKTGRIAGVYDSKQLQELSGDQGINALLRDAVQTHGLYPKELSLILAQAMADTVAGQNIDIGKRITQLLDHPDERKNYELNPVVEDMLSRLITGLMKNREARTV